MRLAVVCIARYGDCCQKGTRNYPLRLPIRWTVLCDNSNVRKRRRKASSVVAFNVERARYGTDGSSITHLCQQRCMIVFDAKGSQMCYRWDGGEKSITSHYPRRFWCAVSSALSSFRREIVRQALVPIKPIYIYRFEN